MNSVKKPIKVLFLGGAHAQIPILKEAKARGYYLITCDYLPGNPGHKLANEYYNVSTTDMPGVLNLAKKVKPDLIIAYASDPSAPVAAFVSENLGLPGNPYDSVRILSEKDLFRAYQKDRGFNVPEFVLLTEDNHFDEKLRILRFPYIIKPTDSSGSRGISRVTKPDEITFALTSALSFSRKKRIIAEEFIDNELGDIHGDGFVVDGKLVFSYLGDHIYNRKSNPYNPIGTLWPSKLPESIINKIVKDVADLIKGSGFKNGPVNIEVRINSRGKHYIMEIGPRSGGHFVPQAIHYATGVDMVKASLDVIRGENIKIPDRSRKCSAYYAIHSDYEGFLLHLSISDGLKPYIKEFHQYISPGERVKSFKSANAVIGILLMTFNKREEMDCIITDISKFIDLKIIDVGGKIINLE